MGNLADFRPVSEYQAYISSSAWFEKREQAFAFYGRACQKCGSPRNIEVHHMHYRTLGHERMQDLRVLCEGCHPGADAIRREHARRLMAWRYRRKNGCWPK